MKRKLLTLVLVLFLYPKTYSQDITFTTTEATQKYDSAGKEIIFNFKLKNISNTEQTVFILRKNISLPSGWTSSICIGARCFLATLDSIVTILDYGSNPLKPSEEIDVSLHVFSKSINEEANVKIQTGTLINPDARLTYNLVASTKLSGVEENPFVLKDFKLFQNYPNPFNPGTWIKYSLPSESNVTLTVYNILGEVIKILVDNVKQTGNNQAYFSSKSVSSGLYFYTLSVNSLNGRQNFSDAKKMILIK